MKSPFPPTADRACPLNKSQRTLAALGAAALAGWALTRLARRVSGCDFAGKAVLITGGSRGLGLALARRFCAAGARVALVARDPAELRRAQSELQARGGDVFTIVADLTDPAEIRRTVALAVEVFGGLDVLVNNAGAIQVGPLEHMQEADFEHAMQLHFWTPLRLVRAALPHLRGRERGEARIVNIASFGGLVSFPHLAPYNASKHALVGLSDALRAELAHEGVRVTTVSPGVLRTGSHLNATFKGRHAEEFDWFSLGMNFPVQAMGADKAARRIVEAARRGQPSVILTLPARMAVAANALAPNLTARVLAFVNDHLLPQPASSHAEGDTLKTGWESRSPAVTPEWKTALADEANARLNGGLNNGHARR
ncbi:MAG: SDR family NAD(P)-dependent oxidoreductase [Verrucomicrobia bacterium]|nr:SDR family NAD(P)-dependent oxidoreductase [Verrucomicrobiota bacterium]MBV9658959.1 SDR family NAD(P)-dependent oxidoreductase [Verrucomicrobiota bacterium]